MSLLNETKKAIEQSGHTPEQIVFIGSESSGHSCTWEEFKVLADVEYDSGFGSQKVATDLIIAFKDGQKMWRGEYDGSEWWNYSKPVKLPSERKPIKRLVTDEDVDLCCGWNSLEELNK